MHVHFHNDSIREEKEKHRKEKKKATHLKSNSQNPKLLARCFRCR